MTFKGLTVVVNTGLLLVSFLEVDGARASEEDGVPEHGEIWAVPKRERVVPEQHESEAGQSSDAPC